jgi:hypothetical protein
MDFATDNLIARVLLTLTTLGYGLVPMIVDLSKTHATNPLWTPHARFHVVWQVTSYCGVGLISLWLIWSAGPATKLWLAVALAVAMYAGFFAAAIAMPRFGGSLTDTNGVPPIATVSLGGRPLVLDANMTAFSVMSTIVVIAALTIR